MLARIDKNCQKCRALEVRDTIVSFKMATNDVTMDVTMTSRQEVDVKMRKRLVRNIRIMRMPMEAGVRLQKREGIWWLASRGKGHSDKVVTVVKLKKIFYLRIIVRYVDHNGNLATNINHNSRGVVKIG